MGPPGLAQRGVRWLLNKVTRVYFSRVEVRGLRNLPQGSCIMAGNHPSGVLDPMVLMTALPTRRISSVAKHSLFSMQPIGFFLKMMDAVPVAKVDDVNLAPGKQASAEERREMNKRMFATVAERLRSGVTICIFPEGTCHSLPEIKELKTGTARMALEAAATGWRVPVVPVGLSYSEPSGSVFRGSVLVDIGRPIDVTDEAVAEFLSGPEGAAHACQDLTERLERYLRHVTIAAPNWVDELQRLCDREGWGSPTYEMVAEAGEAPIRVELTQGAEAIDARRRRCIVTVNGRQFQSPKETPAQVRHRRLRAQRGRAPEPPGSLMRSAAHKAFYGLSGADEVSDEELVETVHLMRRLYKPDGMQLTLTQYAALTRNIITGYLRTGALRDPEMRALWVQLARYRELLRVTGVKDRYVAAHAVNSDPMGERLRRMRGMAVRDLARLTLVVPLSAVGTVLHAHIGALSTWAAARFGVAPDGDRSVVATVKVIAGFIGCMVTWPLVGLSAAYIVGPQWTLPAALGAAISGYVAATEDDMRTEINAMRRSVRKLVADDTIDRMRITRAKLQAETRAICDRYCGEELKGWWKNPEAFVDALRQKERAWEDALLVVTEKAIAGAGLRHLRIPLQRDLRHAKETAVLTLKQSAANNKALLWIPGRNDSFFHVHVLDELLGAGFDLVALDLRRCGRARIAPDGTEVCPPELAHDSHDFHEYFEEVDAALRFLKTPYEAPSGDWLDPDGLVTPGGPQGSGKYYEKVVVYAHSTGALIAALYGADAGGAWRGAIDGYVFNSPFWNWNVSWHQGLAMSAIASEGLQRLGGLSDDYQLVAGGDPNTYSERMRRHYFFSEDIKSLRTLAVTAGWVRAATHVQQRLKRRELLLRRPILSLFTEADDVLSYKDIDRLNELLTSAGVDGKDQPLSSRGLVERCIESTPSEPSGHDVLAAESPRRVQEALNEVTGWLSAHYGLLADAGGPLRPATAALLGVAQAHAARA